MHLPNHILLKNIFTKDKGLKPITTNAQQIPKCTNPQVPVKAHLSPVSSELPFHSAACNNPLIITHLKKNKTILKHWIQPFVPLSSLLVRGRFYISPPSSRGALSRSFVLGNQRVTLWLPLTSLRTVHQELEALRVWRHVGASTLCLHGQISAHTCGFKRHKQQ